MSQPECAGGAPERRVAPRAIRYARAAALAVALGGGVAAGAAAGCTGGAGADPRPARFTFIAATILAPQCATSSCHSRVARVAGLVFDTPAESFESLADLGALEPEVVGSAPGSDVSCNPLLLATRGSAPCAGKGESVTMPPDAPLPEADVALLETWLLEGASYP